MAVIREQRQFQIGPIGVARASEGGRTVGTAIAQSADQLAGQFFKLAAEDAQKAGTEAGMTAEDVVTIDPKTGEPVSYAAPKGFGRIAADAYQRVVLRRFQQSIDDEMQNKAKELAFKYEENANGVSLYTSAMSDYIASMSNAAEGQFKTYINETGTAYLNSTRTAMGIAQIRRERAAAAKAQEEAVNNGLESIRFLVAKNGPNSLTGPTSTQAIVQSVRTTIGDGNDAGLFNPAQVRGQNENVQLAVAAGLIQYGLRQTKDPETLTILKGAIGSRNFDAIPAEFGYIADALRGFGSNESALAKLEKASDGLLDDAISYSTVLHNQEVERQAAEQDLRVFDLANNSALMTSTRSAYAASPENNPVASADRAFSSYSDTMGDARSALIAGNEDLSKELVRQAQADVRGVAKALYARTLSGLSTDDTQSLERALFESNPSLAPASKREEVRAIIKLGRDTNIDVVSEFLPVIGSYREAAGKDIDLMLEVNASIEASKIDMAEITRAQFPDDAYASAVQKINGIANLEDSVRQSMLAEAQTRAGLSHLNKFFATNPTKEQLAEANSALAGGVVAGGILTSVQADRLANAREYYLAAGKESTLTTKFNEQRATQNERIAAAEERQEQLTKLSDIYGGRASPTDKEARVLFEEDLERRYASALGGRPLSSIWSDRSAMDRPETLQILDELSRANIMPQSLHNALTQFAKGGWQGGDPTALLSHYANFRSYNYQGIEMTNPMMDALTNAERAALDYLNDLAPIFGSDPTMLAKVFSTKQEYESDPNLKAKVESYLGGQSIGDFVLGLKGIENAPLSAINEMNGVALQMYTMGVPSGDIKDRMEKQLNHMYPSGGGVVFGPNKASSTRFPISRAAPNNEDIFKFHVINRITETNPDIKNVVLGAGRVSVARDGALPMPLTLPQKVEDYFYLVPHDVSADGEIRYRVMQTQPLEAGGDKVVFDGKAPLIISNRDRAFLAERRARSTARQRDQIERGYEIMRRQDELSSMSIGEFGGP